MVLGITGFTDATEILEELFTLVATIELVQHAYAESDAYFS